ncbi:MAG: hypothetical protein ISS78_08455 [Phycisphaerae bacterium]|nr:hypothetical protein [Phycisphaerae bacterium]
MNRQGARAIIDAMLKQSRLLEDVHFRIPRSVWQRYVLARAAARPPKPPAGCIRPMGTYRLSVSGDGQVALAAELHLHVFDARSARNLPVLPANLAWSDVRLAVGDNKPATVRLATVNRWLRYTPAAGGRHVISARVQLNRLSGRSGTLKLSVPVTVRTQIVFHSPRVFHVTTNSPAMTLTGKEGAGTHGVISLEPVSSLQISYAPPVVRRQRAARYQIDGHVAWNLGAANQQVAAALRVAIVDGRTDRLELSLPAGADRVSITGPDVREAQPRVGGATVFLRGTITGQTRLKVSYEVASAAGPMRRLARPDIGSGNWTGGTLVVTNTAGGSELMPAAMTGLKEMALADIPSLASAILTGKAVLAYGITSRGWSASLETIDLGEFALRETIADTAHFTLAYRAHGVVICAADYEIRNRNRQFLRVSLPRGAKVLLARVSERSRPLTPLGGPGPKGRPDTYLLPLERSTASVKGLVSFPVQVVYMYQSQPLGRQGAAGAVLPRIDMPIAYAWCEGYLPQGAGKLEFAGALQPVEEYSSKTAVATLGYGQAVALKPPKPEPRPRPLAPEPAPKPRAKPAPGKPVRISRSRLLATKLMPDKRMLWRNYWRAGQEFYKQGKYDEAQKALKKVIELYPKSNEAANAMRLYSNIDLLQGKLKLRGRAQKAAAAAVQQDIAIANVGDLQRQQELVEEGLVAAGKGDKKAAEVRFKAAESLGKELLSRGASTTEQRARLRDVREHLRQSRESVRAQAVTALGQLRMLRKSGRLKEARQVAQQLADVTESLDAADGEGEAGKQREVRKELEKLAVETSKHVAQRERKLRLQTDLTDVTTERDQLAGLVKRRSEQIKRLQAEDRELAARSGEPTTQVAAPVLVDPRGQGRKPARLEDQLTHATGQRDRIDRLARRQEVYILDLQVRRKKLTGKLPKPSGEMDALEATSSDVAVAPGGPARPRGAGQPTKRPVPRKPRMVTQVYDVRDLVADVPSFGKDRGKRGADRMDEDRKRNARELSGQLKKLLAEAGEKNASITLSNGQAVVVAREGGQRIAHGLFWGLRDARGRQVQKGKSIIRQEVAGTLKTGTIRDDYGADVGGGVRVLDRSGSMEDATATADSRKAQPEFTDEFKKFIATNYGWQKRADLSAIKEWTKDIREGDRPATRPVAGMGVLKVRLPKPRFVGTPRRIRVDNAPPGGPKPDKPLRVPIGLKNLARGKAITASDDDPVIGKLQYITDGDKEARDGSLVELAPGKQHVQIDLGAVSEIFAIVVWHDHRIAQVYRDVVAQVSNDENFIDKKTVFNNDHNNSSGLGLGKDYEWIETNHGKIMPAGGVKGRYVRLYSRGSTSGDENHYTEVEVYGRPEGEGARPATQPVAGGFVYAYDEKELAGRLRYNRGQKVNVSTINVNADANTAGGLGIHFTTGNNDVRYAVVDEAQFRTLMEVDARRRDGRIDANERYQGTIVGTDALLANDWVGNVLQSSDADNTLDINGNPIRLSHEKYILIDNGRFLTAVRAGQMQHWTQKAEAVAFVRAPQTIDIPRVGELVKLEKTLVKPEDELVIRFNYQWKGAGK